MEILSQISNPARDGYTCCHTPSPMVLDMTGGECTPSVEIGSNHIVCQYQTKMLMYAPKDHPVFTNEAHKFNF